MYIDRSNDMNIEPYDDTAQRNKAGYYSRRLKTLLTLEVIDDTLIIDIESVQRETEKGLKIQFMTTPLLPGVWLPKSAVTVFAVEDTLKIEVHNWLFIKIAETLIAQLTKETNHGTT